MAVNQKHLCVDEEHADFRHIGIINCLFYFLGYNAKNT